MNKINFILKYIDRLHVIHIDFSGDNSWQQKCFVVRYLI